LSILYFKTEFAPEVHWNLQWPCTILFWKVFIISQ